MKRLSIIILFVLLQFSVSNATSLETAPPDWPWRGITIEGTSTREDIAKLAEMKVNVVVLQLNVRNIAQYKHLTPQEAWDNRLAWADEMLDACKKNGMTCIISMFQFPIDPNLGLTQDSPAYWNSQRLQKQTVDLVGKLVEHFKNTGVELAAYDILSEPLVRFALGIQKTPSEWSALQDAIIRKIRQIDSKRYIIVTPGYGGMPSSYTDFKPLSYSKLIYSAHMYSPHGFTHQGLPGFAYGKEYPSVFPQLNKDKLIGYMQPVIDFKEKYNALVYIGEFSAARWASGSDEYVSDLIDIFDRNGFSWMYYSYGFHAWNPSYSNQYSNGDEYKKQYIGENTPRWKILKRAFTKNK